ncbi:MAG TPA: nuclear transport factor 2 family protein [Candidatus Acidoferrales bacterium]
MTPVETVLAYMDRINNRDPEKVAALMTDDAEFIDSLGGKIAGRANLVKAWKAYYAICPDYWVEHEEVLGDGKTVAVFGGAGGTIAEGPGDGPGRTPPPRNKWRVTAAWMAVVEGGLIRKWQVYADNKPVYDILARIAAK